MKQQLTKCVALLAVLVVAIAFSILTLIYGYGLKPVNWWAIIGFGVIGQLFAQTIGRWIIDDDK